MARSTRMKRTISTQSAVLARSTSLRTSPLSHAGLEDLAGLLDRALVAAPEALGVVGHQDPVVLTQDRLEDGALEREGDRALQLGPQTGQAVGGLRRVGGCDLLEPLVEGGVEHGVDQRLLAREVLVDHGTGQACRGRDLVDGRPLEAVLGDAAPGRLEDAGALKGRAGVVGVHIADIYISAS